MKHSTPTCIATLAAEVSPLAIVPTENPAGSAVSITMASIASLPDHVLTLVMQHVPLKSRLCSCSFVSKRLHAAAVAATQHLEVMLRPSLPWFTSACPTYSKLDNTLWWISKYGKHLTSLSMTTHSLLATDSFPLPALRQLECQHLLDLEVIGGIVQLGPTDDGIAGIIVGCNKLTRLELRGCHIIDVREGGLAACLSSLVHLQHLTVLPTRLGGEAGEPAPSIDLPVYPEYPEPRLFGGLSLATLPGLQHLTCLRVGSLSIDNLLQLDALSGLKQLNLWAESALIGPKAVPGLAFPPSLETLVLGLSSPVEAAILSLVPTGLQALHIGRVPVECPLQGPDAILSCMARLQHLTVLSLECYESAHWPPVGPAYSALTASTGLVHLEMLDMACPEGIWPYVFPAGRKLPHLTYLEVCDMQKVDLQGVPHPEGPKALPLYSWGAADLSSLVSCCPGLCEIFNVSLQPGLHVSELQKLTALTNMGVSYDINGQEAVGGLAALTQLKELTLVQVSQESKLSSLLPMTSLTALTFFEVDLDHCIDGSKHPWPQFVLCDTFSNKAALQALMPQTAFPQVSQSDTAAPSWPCRPTLSLCQLLTRCEPVSPV